MTKATAWWQSAAQAPPPEAFYDFVLWNDSRQLQAYDFDGTDITTVGNAGSALTIASADRGGVSALGANSVVVAGSDGFNDREMGKYDFDGTDWALDGNILTLGTSFVAQAGLTPTRAAIAFASTPGIQAYDHDGTDWATVGSSNTSGESRTIDALSSTEVISNQTSFNRIRTLTFDGANWTISNSSNQAFVVRGLCAMTSTLAAVWDASNGQLKAFSRGATWAQTGNALAIAGVGNASMAALSATRIVLASSSLNTLQVYDWDGSDWSAVGNSLAAAVPEYNNLTGNSYRLSSDG